MLDILVYILWGAAGTGVGLLLGWWQSRAIMKLEKNAPEKIMGRVYLGSLPRVLLVTGLLFVAMTQGLWYGICFAAGFTVSRWVWTWLALRQLKKEGD
jgi:uncharacterized protein YneF (UPF0154 family)